MIFVGDDWAEDHHDVHLIDDSGGRLAPRRLPAGLAGIGKFHQLLTRHVEEPEQVAIGIETDRGLWVEALIAASALRKFRPFCALSSSPPPPRVSAAFAATTRATVGHRRTEPPDQQPRSRTGNTFETLPDADIYLSLPGLGVILGARVLEASKPATGSTIAVVGRSSHSPASASAGWVPLRSASDAC